MINYKRLFLTLFIGTAICHATAQSTATSSSPYSVFGLGDISSQLMPQNIAMGHIAAATNTIGGYNSINVVNPASYGSINYTTIDAGVYVSSMSLSQNGFGSQRFSNTRISHVAFAIPVTKASAFSFGLLPYSDLGYNYRSSRNNLGSGSPVDTNSVNYIYSGNGGLSKAYLGYGFAIGRHLTLGANLSYLFGNLQQFRSTEFPSLYGTLDSRLEEDNHVGGFNFDYGIQYSIDFSTVHHLVLGYSASAGNKINVQNNFIVSQYYYDAAGNQNVAADSLINTQNPKGKIQLPVINHFGIAFTKEAAYQSSGASYLIGADYTTGNWSQLSIAGSNAGLQDSRMISVGGELTPNPNALSNYFALMNYSLGFLYEDTYINVNGTNIKREAVTFGLGVPLPHDRASSAFYKFNLSGELGRRGTLSNGLVQENYVNVHLSFTLNDKWFQRFRFE